MQATPEFLQRATVHYRSTPGGCGGAYALLSALPDARALLARLAGGQTNLAGQVLDGGAIFVPAAAAPARVELCEGRNAVLIGCDVPFAELVRLLESAASLTVIAEGEPAGLRQLVAYCRLMRGLAEVDAELARGGQPDRKLRQLSAAKEKHLRDLESLGRLAEAGGSSGEGDVVHHAEVMLIATMSSYEGRAFLCPEMGVAVYAESGVSCVRAAWEWARPGVEMPEALRCVALERPADSPRDKLLQRALLSPSSPEVTLPLLARLAGGIPDDVLARGRAILAAEGEIIAELVSNASTIPMVLRVMPGPHDVRIFMAHTHGVVSRHIAMPLLCEGLLDAVKARNIDLVLLWANADMEGFILVVGYSRTVDLLDLFSRIEGVHALKGGPRLVGFLAESSTFNVSCNNPGCENCQT